MDDESQYKILRTGDVYLVNKKRNALRYYMSTCKDKHPYIQIGGSNRKLARVVLEHFRPILNTRHFMVRYADGDVDNCSLDNISWTPRSDEIKKQKMGRKRGVSAVNGKWVATITERGKTTYLGSFEIKERAYDAFWIEYKKRNGVAPW